MTTIPITKTFNQLYPTYADWQNLVEKKAFAMFPSESEIINTATQFIPFGQLYEALNNQYYSRNCRYNDAEQSMRLANKFADEIVNIWIKTRPYISNQLADLKEVKHRGDNEFFTDNTEDNILGKADVTATNDQIANSANSTTPFVSTGIPIGADENMYAKRGDTSNQKGVSSSTNTIDKIKNVDRNINKYNIIEDILKIVHSRLSLELSAFVGSFNDLFQVINAIPLQNTWNFTQCWNTQLLGALYKDLIQIIKQGPNMVIDFDETNGIPTIKFSAKTGSKDIEYKGSALAWNQTSLFLTKLDVAGTGWIICGAEISTETTDGVIICPPGDFYQDDNYNLIIKGKIDYSVNIWQDDAKTQLFRNYQIDYNPSYITSSGTVIEVTDQTEGIDWVVTNCFKYNGKVYAMLWYIPYQATLNPGLTWNRVTIQSNTPFTEITAIKEV